MTIHYVVRLSFFLFHLNSRYWRVYTFLQILTSNIHILSRNNLLVTFSLYIYLSLFLLCWQFMRHPFLQFSDQVCHLWLSMQQHSAFPLCLCCVCAICMYGHMQQKKGWNFHKCIQYLPFSRMNFKKDVAKKRPICDRAFQTKTSRFYQASCTAKCSMLHGGKYSS